MAISIHSAYFLRLIISFATVALIACSSQAQSKNPALDSMGANMGKQNWKAAMQWALKAAEAEPKEKYWRFLNAADFASRDKNADLAFNYLEYVVNSDIILNASYSLKSFELLHNDPRWEGLMNKVAQARQRERQQRIQASLPFRSYQEELVSQANQQLASLSKTASVPGLYQQLQTARPTHAYSRTGQYQYAWLRLRDSLEFPYLVQLPPQFDAAKRSVTTVHLSSPITGSDGLLLSGQSLYVVNYISGIVTELKTIDNWTSATVASEYSTEVGSSAATLAEGTIYILNARVTEIEIDPGRALSDTYTITKFKEK